MSSVFDAYAAGYDADFTERALGRMLRQRVWEVLAGQFQAGERVLELACGTGEDAVWLARRGVLVMATDGSRRMLDVAAEKAKRAGVAEMVAFRQVDIREWRSEIGESMTARANAAPPSSLSNTQFDGALSNFGGLNVLSDWRPLAETLAKALKPDGRVVLTPMGPVCPWETGWHLLHGDLRTAFRRLRQPAFARIGDASIPIWYPSVRRLRRDFAPWFEHLFTESLGLWLPPSHLAHLVDRFPRLFAWLDRLERRTARLSRGWGDHYILVLQRR